MFPIRHLHSDFGIFHTPFGHRHLWYFDPHQDQISKIIIVKKLIIIVNFWDFRVAKLQNNSIRRKPVFLLEKNA